MANIFYVPIFFIVFRETIETSIIVAVLLAFLKQQLGAGLDAVTYKALRRQVWFGTGLGLLLCVIIGAALIGTFYGLGKNTWAGTENLWEAAFSLVAAVIITIMGAALLRVTKLKEKWQLKLAKAMESTGNSRNIPARFRLWCQKYAMFILPFITVLREGLEAIIFVGGVSLGASAKSIPLPTVVGLIGGSIIGLIIYKGGSLAPLQLFLIVSTCFLYLVSAGLFSKAVLLFELNKWNVMTGGDAIEGGSGPGSYNIRQSVWHVNCCSPFLNKGNSWSVFYALFGWTNSATYGSVISYNLYWLAVIMWFSWMILRESRKANALEGGDQVSQMLANNEGTVVIEDAIDGTARSTAALKRSGA